MATDQPKNPNESPPISEAPEQTTPVAPESENNATAQPDNTATPQGENPASITPPLGKLPPLPPGIVPFDPKLLLQNKKLLLFAGGGLFVLILFIIILASVFSVKSMRQTDMQSNVTPTLSNAQNKAETKPTAKGSKNTNDTMVYGTWTSRSSVIRALDLNTSKAITLATLPLSVKKISVLGKNTILYIDQTDSRSNGQRISIYDRDLNQITTNIPAASGFAIANYALSPNKQFLALWEIKTSRETGTFNEGSSRIYMVDLTRPTITVPIYDETISSAIPAHTPIAVLNDGTTFTDKFIIDSNNTFDMEYGLSVVEADGSNKRDIDAMQAGTYGSEPQLSSDGNYLLFAGYTGNDGMSIANFGTRQAILNPNSVELLNTTSLQRFRLPHISTSNTFANVQWDTITGDVIMTILTDQQPIGVYSYDLGKEVPVKIAIPDRQPAPYTFIAKLENNNTLVGAQSTSTANLGNLGDQVEYAFSQLVIVNPKDQPKYVTSPDQFIQFITIKPSNYFGN